MHMSTIRYPTDPTLSREERRGIPFDTGPGGMMQWDFRVAWDSRREWLVALRVGQGLGKVLATQIYLR